MVSLKAISVLAVAVAALASPPDVTLAKRANPYGIDVSGHQPSVNWNTVKANGIIFAYIKATEGTGRCRSLCVI